MKFYLLIERFFLRLFIFYYKFCFFLKEKKYLLNFYFFLLGGRVIVRRFGDVEYGSRLLG